MMYIKENSLERLRIETPDMVHKVQGIIFTTLGFLFTTGMLVSGEPVFTAIFPILLFIAGVLFLNFGGKPDVLEVDKKSRRISVLIRRGAFSRDEPVIYEMDDVKSWQLEKSSTLGMANVTARRTSGIELTLKNGKTVQATPLVNRRKKVEKAFEAFQEALK